MATYTEIKLVDDLDGGPGDETVEFGLDGRDYEIDLSDANAQRLRDALAEFVANGRKAGRPEKPGKPEKPGRRRHDGNGGGKLDRDEAGAIRDWVRQHGGEINDRGRVPRKYVDAYHNDDTSIFEGGGDSDETPEPEPDPVNVGEPFGAQPHF